MGSDTPTDRYRVPTPPTSKTTNRQHQQRREVFLLLIGTPMYMAPELASGSKYARPAADLFALGVIAYELLAKEMPFSSPVVWAKRPSDLKVAVPFRSLGLALPDSLLGLLERCLHPDPLMRPTAERLHTALAGLPPIAKQSRPDT